jgi:hypothetical protein
VSVESLEELKAAFSKWRSEKKRRRDQTPEELVKRARAAAKVYGVGRVARETGIDGRHLIDGSQYPKGRGKAAAKSVAAYSRVELTAPSAIGRAITELELPSGVKLRLYSQTPEMLKLVSSLCEFRGAR